MKRCISFIFLFFSGVLFAQISAPQPSLSAKLSQVVGLTEIEVNYSRPLARGRTIMGELVPYNVLWRTGANANTTITFGDDVRIGNNKVAAGTYALYSRPSEESWDLYLYKKADNWGVPETWDSSQIAATFNAKVHKASSMVEAFTIDFKKLTNNSAVLELSWEHTKVMLPVAVPTELKMEKMIAKTMSKDPTPSDYFNAAGYYLAEKKSLQKAKVWMQKALQTSDDKYWMHRRHALILAELGEHKAAIQAAKTSLKLAQAAGNMDYVRLNKNSIAAWQD